MRHLITACALVLVGLAAAAPFRQSAGEVSSPSAQIASGPFGTQLTSESGLNVSQWLDRSDADPAIAWQTQPMHFQRDVHALELPDMPPEFSFDEVDKAVPQPIQNRFGAAISPLSSSTRNEPIADQASLQAPPFAGESVEPLPTTVTPRSHDLTVQGVSTVPSTAPTLVMRPRLENAAPAPVQEEPNTSQVSTPPMATQVRHYIREPQ